MSELGKDENDAFTTIFSEKYQNGDLDAKAKGIPKKKSKLLGNFF